MFALIELYGRKVKSVVDLTCFFTCLKLSKLGKCYVFMYRVFDNEGSTGVSLIQVYLFSSIGHWPLFSF